MSRIVAIFILGFFIASCTSNTILEKPDDLIPKDQMVELLSDLLLAQGGRNIKNINLERKVNYFPLVFQKYNIDTAQFKRSNYYYTSRIDDYTEILADVKANLESRKLIYDRDRIKSDSLVDQQMLPEGYDDY